MVVTVFLLTVATRTPSVGENQASAWHFGDIVDMAARVAIVTLDDKNIGLVRVEKIFLYPCHVLPTLCHYHLGRE
jgi:hypothetical protein